MGKSIVFCRCGGERITSEQLQGIEKMLTEAAAEVVVLTDLCLLTVTGREQLKDLFGEGKEYLIIGCYDRSMKLLLEQVHAGIEKVEVAFLNFLELTNEEIAVKLTDFCKDSNQVHSYREIGLSTAWKSWYPIIDYTRCTACGQCHDFCLFGVYEKREGKVVVVKPQACKNNCPACGRICPHTAIVFPKYLYGGAIGGSEIVDEVAEQQRQSADVQTILAGDIYQALEQRKLRRQSIIRNEAMKKAMEERDKALKEFKWL
jgi:NAD-dependent dihydropyrimidine dehydrogenase PreA subunit